MFYAKQNVLNLRVIEGRELFFSISLAFCNIMLAPVKVSPFCVI
jgi:hypothetical protein